MKYETWKWRKYYLKLRDFEKHNDRKNDDVGINIDLKRTGECEHWSRKKQSYTWFRIVSSARKIPK